MSNSSFNTYSDDKCTNLLKTEKIISDGKTCNQALNGNMIVSLVTGISETVTKGYSILLS